jgi:hypothetical protein
MSLSSIKYLQSIENTAQYYNAFIISFIGLIGLAKLNENSNMINLKLKQYRVILNSISAKNLDVYIIIQDLFNKKMITLSYGLRLVEVLQMFRTESSIDEIVDEAIDVLNDLPSVLVQKLSVDIRVVYSSVNSGNIDDLVIRLYNYANRKNMKLDFVDIAKTVRKM